MPSWIFFHASEAVKMQESRMPATVKVPPMMAQICKRVREQTVCQEISAERHQAGTLLHHEKLTHEDTLPMIPNWFAILSMRVFRDQREPLVG